MVDRGADATFHASPSIFIFVVAITTFTIAFDVFFFVVVVFVVSPAALSLVALSQSDAQLV